jgi:hypothetical protein
MVYDACRDAGIIIAKCDNPSCGEIEKYNAFTILFDRR